MKKIYFIIKLITICAIVKMEPIIVGSLIEDFYAQKFVHQVTVFSCWSNFGTIRIEFYEIICIILSL